jgi:hypothetical protein
MNRLGINRMNHTLLPVRAHLLACKHPTSRSARAAEILRAGAALGRQIAALLDPETPVEGVTTLKVRPDLQGLGELDVKSAGATKEGDSKVVRTVPCAADRKSTGARNPAQRTVRTTLSPDLAIAARWGYAGQGGVTMPGPGKVTSGTRGEGYLDIHLNATTRWKDVPEAVWNYTLGGYQVLKKWLSYRESALLGRPSPATKPNNSPTTSAASPPSSLCTRNWMRTMGRVFDATMSTSSSI